MVLIDSSVWIDYFNGKETPATNQLDSLLVIEPVSIGDLILTEVLQRDANRIEDLQDTWYQNGNSCGR